MPILYHGLTGDMEVLFVLGPLNTKWANTSEEGLQGVLLSVVSHSLLLRGLPG